MPISTLNDYLRLSNFSGKQINFEKATTTFATTLPFSQWTNTPNAGTAPTTSVVCTNATAGSIPHFITSGTIRLLRAYIATNTSLLTYLLVDRLVHSGGLSAIVTGSQSTNLPTAALTRYTSGNGVFAATENYAAVGTTGTTATVSYVDDAGNASTSPPFPFGGPNQNGVGLMRIVPLLAGDAGVRSVSAINLVATTGTAGNFGITLFKPLAMFSPRVPNSFSEFDSLLSLAQKFQEIRPSACLQVIVLASGSLAAQPRGTLFVSVE